jgi:hypothetical protein
VRTKAIAKNECLYHALEDLYFTMLKKVDGNAFLIFTYQKNIFGQFLQEKQISGKSPIKVLL